MYELVSAVGAGNPYFSPHTIKARLSFIHKGVPFETKEVTFKEIRTTLAERLGKRGSGTLAPCLHASNGPALTTSLFPPISSRCGFAWLKSQFWSSRTDP